MVKTLVEAGADMNIMDNTSKTPLELAFDNNFTDIFNYLRDKCGNNYFESVSDVVVNVKVFRLCTEWGKGIKCRYSSRKSTKTFS